MPRKMIIKAFKQWMIYKSNQSIQYFHNSFKQYNESKAF